jgi:hypothetical protein
MCGIENLLICKSIYSRWLRDARGILSLHASQIDRNSCFMSYFLAHLVIREEFRNILHLIVHEHEVQKIDLILPLLNDFDVFFRDIQALNSVKNKIFKVKRLFILLKIIYISQI